MPIITLVPSGRTITAQPDQTLVAALADAGVAMPTPCGGKGSCGRCRVHITAPADAWRLACQTACTQDMAVEEPHADQNLRVASGFGARAPRQAPDCGPGPRLAVDLGTTTLAAALLDASVPDAQTLVTAPNPQALRGDDVISRIDYAGRGQTQRAELQQCIVHACEELANQALARAGLAGPLRELCVAGNTAMLHLLLGVDPSPLAVSPFTPPFVTVPDFSAADIGWSGSPAPMVSLVPCCSAFIGGDITAGILALGLGADGRTELLLDAGTNGEMVLADGGQLFACSAAAGPAFEGARLRQGMRASDGAVCTVELAADGLHAVVIGSGPARGICGSGVLDVVAALLRAGALLPDGRLLDDEEAAARGVRPGVVQLLDTDNGEACVWIAPPAPDSPGVRLWQQDIRQLQLAKGAVAAGADMLLAHAGITAADLDAVLLAGGLGAALAPASAIAAGLLPEGVNAERVRAVGNTALAGARLSLLSSAERTDAARLASKTRTLVLAGRPDFESAFIQRMNFPAP